MKVDSPPPSPPRFDQGTFLLHYNKGREAFQEGRFGPARQHLEAAQQLRPENEDVLNLLGLVYFKTEALPEAEVIYQRLVLTNDSVFILHSNLGLILYKLGKLDEAENHLKRSLELRPNHLKSHLYLGLLYQKEQKHELAAEHLRFARAEKPLKEVEAELSRTTAEAPQSELALEPSVHRREKDLPVQDEVQSASPPPPTEPEVPTVEPAISRKLRETIDEPEQQPSGTFSDPDRKIEGASKTFALHQNGFLELNFSKSVHVKRGTVSSYSGNLRFTPDAALLGRSGATVVKAEGDGKIFLFERGKKTFLLDLNNEFIFVEGRNLLAIENSLSYKLQPVYHSSLERKLDVLKIFGTGSIAISTSIEPLTLRVTPQLPLSISSNALVAWTGALTPLAVDDLDDLMIQSADQGFQIRFEGDGVVVAEQ